MTQIDLRPYQSRLSALTPGIILAFTIAAAAAFIAEARNLPIMLLAMLIGMAFHHMHLDNTNCKAGIDFTSSTLLRIGVALLGVRVTLDDIMALGVFPVIAIPILVVATIFLGLFISRLFGRKLCFGLLTGGAVAICGASAALAIASVLPKKRAQECDVLFTVIAVTAMSTIAMIFYPILFVKLGFDDNQVGLLLGATIHDVAQVVAAGYDVSNEAGDIATYVKLLRVAMLPIVVLVIALIFRGEKSDEVSSFPWFAVAFATLLLVNSAGLIPEFLRAGLQLTSKWLLIGAISALGIKTSIAAMTQLGPKHLWVVIFETAALVALAIFAISFM